MALLFLLDPSPGAAVDGMRIEINTGFSCYLIVARRRRGRFFSLVDPSLREGSPFALSISDPKCILENNYRLNQFGKGKIVFQLSQDILTIIGLIFASRMTIWIIIVSRIFRTEILRGKR